MGFLLYVLPMLMGFSYRITVLHHTYACLTLGVASVSNLYPQNHCVRPKEQLMLVRSIYGIFGSRQTYGRALLKFRLCL